MEIETVKYCETTAAAAPPSTTASSHFWAKVLLVLFMQPNIPFRFFIIANIYSKCSPLFSVLFRSS